MLSTKERFNIITELKETNFDLVVIGGGMTGAGIILDAASRGLKCAMVEKEDFGWGTSGRSTKLIHGGLRYLKQFQFKTVKEIGLERTIVYKNALHIVRPIKMLLPIIKGGSLGSLGTKVGLAIYDYLAEVSKEERKKILSKEKVLALEPLLDEKKLKGGGLYVEYRTDDSRLVIENIKKAESIGAFPINYMEAIGVNTTEAHYHQVRAKDCITNEVIEITAKVVVNAGGPWVDNIIALEPKKTIEKKLFLSKGVHIVVGRKKFPIKEPVYFDVDVDNRMIFAIPRNDIVYIGPTDTAFDKDVNNPVTELKDVNYILDATNKMFPSLGLTPLDVLSSWSGLRPLIFQEDKSPSEMSRKDEVFVHDSGMITIAGGKLTGYRLMAEKIVNLAVQRLGEIFKVPKRYPACFTNEIKISGSEFINEKELIEYHKVVIRDSKSIGIEEAWLDYLVYTYGRNTDLIIGRYNSETDESITPLQKIIMAEVWYGIDHEMVNSIRDFFIRRTGRLYFNRSFTLEHIDWVITCMSKEMGWNQERMLEEKNSYLKEAAKVIQFQKEI